MEDELQELRDKVADKEKSWNEKKEKGLPVAINENAAMGLRLEMNGKTHDFTFLKFPKFMNRYIPQPIMPLTAEQRRVADKKEEEREEKREEEKEEESIKWKKYLALPIILWLYDWYRSKNGIRPLAEGLIAPYEVECTQLRRIFRLTSEELLQIHNILTEKYKDKKMTFREFSTVLVNCVKTFHNENPDRPVVEPLADRGPQEMGEYRLPQEPITIWDILCLFRNLPEEFTLATKFELWKFIVGLSHFVTDELADKTSAGFKAMQYSINKTDKEGIPFDSLVQLIFI
eukprot:UN31436